MATFHCLTESNDWEGEIWYHYFLDAPGVLDILTRVYNLNGDFTQLETVEISDKESERLTNLDEGGYMQEHWFGELTNADGLKTATDGDLYKGKIREFGKELFEWIWTGEIVCGVCVSYGHLKRFAKSERSYPSED